MAVDKIEKSVVNELNFDVSEDISSLVTEPESAQEETSDQSSEPELPELSSDTPEFFKEGQEKSEESSTQTKEQESTPPGQPASGVEKIKFRSGGKDYELDPVKDKEKLKEFLPFGPIGKQLQTENGRLRQEMRKLQAELKDLEASRADAALARKIKEVQDDPAAVYELATGRKYYDDVKAEAMRMVKYAEASESERAKMDAERREDELKRRVERMEKNLKQSEESVANSKYESRQKELYSLGIPYLREASRSLSIEDKSAKSRAVKTIWREAWAEIEEITGGDHSKITEDMIKREIESASKLLGYSSSEKTEKEVLQTVDKIKKEAKDKIAVAASQRYKAPDKDKLAGLSPTERFDYLRKLGLFGKK